MSTHTGDPHTFEIGLVLAGAVSAGAYTAGIIDYLVEKLEAFEAYKKAHAGENTCPKHKVVIKVISGASAGAMTGVLATANFAGIPATNGSRLRRAWVEEIDISKLLTARDLEDKDAVVESLLDSTVLSEITRAGLQLAPRPVHPSFITDPLDVYLSVTNLRGVPYALSAAGAANGQGHEMSRHADFMHFALIDSGTTPAPDPDDDLIPLARGSLGNTDANWSLFGQSALASGAFPGGLKPRPLRRRASDYDNRLWSIPNEHPTGTPPKCIDQIKIKPNWPNPMPPQYDFLNVDGGVMNNEPLELARENLSKHKGRDRNPRKPIEADCAILLVDPFPEPSGFTADYVPNPDLVSVLGQMFKALKMQARFKADELKLAGDGVTFSRFLIAPTRREQDDTLTEPAITSAILGAFGGFLSEEFREHDYLLGRRNCEWFLKNWFRLDANNPVFSGWDDPAQQKPYPDPDNPFESLPIIPIANPDTEENPLPGRPKSDVVDIKDLKKAVKYRANAVVKRLIDTRLGGSCIAKAGWKMWLRKKAMTTIMGGIKKGLKKLD